MNTKACSNIQRACHDEDRLDKFSIVPGKQMEIKKYISKCLIVGICLFNIMDVMNIYYRSK